jgi:flagellar basal-body rod modification protein FlgD
MAAVAGLLNQGTLSGQQLTETRVAPMAATNTTTNSAAGTNSSSAGITANDFLTLLVTEMKNQDPTANTDPNEYINQLVNVNSLQQLISINETLTAAVGSPDSNAYAQPAAQAVTVNTTADSANSATGTPTIQSLAGKLVNGNLSVPEVQAAANRLAHALDGHLSAPLTR